MVQEIEKLKNVLGINQIKHTALEWAAHNSTEKISTIIVKRPHDSCGEWSTLWYIHSINVSIITNINEEEPEILSGSPKKLDQEGLIQIVEGSSSLRHLSVETKRFDEVPVE